MNKQQRPPFYFLLLLILSGEAVFLLPFVLARIFRPTFLDAFQVDDFQLGTCFSVYGIVALISYALGGGIADRFQPRVLIGTALLLTSLGGFYMMTYPSYFMLKVLFGYWGFTTIFLFWAPMIKATRIWGGAKKQCTAFGLLDGGRGLVAAGTGSVGVYIFALQLGKSVQNASPEMLQDALGKVILFTSIFVAFVGLLVLAFLKSGEPSESTSKRPVLSNYLTALKIPQVWLLMLIVCCAYVGYKSTDYFAQYAENVMSFDKVKSASVGTLLLYLRSVVGISLGFLADRTRPTLWIIFGFSIVLAGALIFASGVLGESTLLFFFISILSTAIGVYALRVLYFAIMEQAKIPLSLTGTVVGLVSVVGYTPDIFASPLMGKIVKESPGELGFQYLFLLLAGFAFVGGICAYLFHRSVRA